MVKPESLDMYDYFKVLCKWTFSGQVSHAAISQLDYCIASHRFYLEILALFCKSMIMKTEFILLAMQRLKKIKGCLCQRSKKTSG